jgi:DNA-binding GntR family transcriptional regulator
METDSKTNIRASDAIELELIRRIISLEFAPGTMINETELAKQFDCGRTPLREALQRLAATHLIVNVPRRGNIIAELKLMDYIKLTESVSILESGITRLAAEKCKEADILGLEDLVRMAEEAGPKADFLSIALLDLKFHVRIAEITQNEYLVDTTLILHRLISRFNHVALSHGMKFDISWQDHKEIIRALREHQGETAARLIHDHMSNVKERIMHAL